MKQNAFFKNHIQIPNSICEYIFWDIYFRVNCECNHLQMVLFNCNSPASGPCLSGILHQSSMRFCECHNCIFWAKVAWNTTPLPNSKTILSLIIIKRLKTFYVNYVISCVHDLLGKLENFFLTLSVKVIWCLKNKMQNQCGKNPRNTLTHLQEWTDESSPSK